MRGIHHTKRCDEYHGTIGAVGSFVYVSTESIGSSIHSQSYCFTYIYFISLFTYGPVLQDVFKILILRRRAMVLTCILALPTFSACRRKAT